MLTDSASNIVSQQVHSRITQLSLSEEDGSLQLSTRDNGKPIVFFTDLEPLYKDLFAIVSKVIDIQETVPYIRSPLTGNYVSHAHACRIVSADGTVNFWDGTTVPVGDIYSLKGKLLCHGSDKPYIVNYAKNTAVFNFALVVLDAIIERSRAYSKGAKAIVFEDRFKSLITPENYLFNAEQHAYYATRQRLRHDIVTEIVQQEIRNRAVKFEPMTDIEAQNFYSVKSMEFDEETRQVIFRDSLTCENITELGDKIMILLRNMQNYQQMIDLLAMNEWAIFATELGSRPTHPYGATIRFCGDLRIVQWEKEHLHEYTDKLA